MSKKNENVSDKIEQVEVSKLIPYEGNPRKHGKAIDALCKSISDYGWTVPMIIDQNNRIIAGHGRLQAAKLLNRFKVPCIRANVSNKEYLELLLADNKIASLSKYNKEAHQEIMITLKDLDSVIAEIPGYDAEEIDKIFGLATKETLNSGDFGDAGEIDGEIDPDAKVVSMTFKLPKKHHVKIKDVLTAIKRENEFETLSESLIFAMSSFKGTTKTIRR